MHLAGEHEVGLTADLKLEVAALVNDPRHRVRGHRRTAKRCTNKSRDADPMRHQKLTPADMKIVRPTTS